jgi:hypothetical protein
MIAGACAFGNVRHEVGRLGLGGTPAFFSVLPMVVLPAGSGCRGWGRAPQVLAT